jgi:tetratricopeptide (TPR) repeat protein
MAAFAEAQSEFELGQAESALDAEFYFSYGAAAEQAGLHEKAAEMLKRAIELEPEGQIAAQAYNYLGYMWVDRGEKLDEAGDLIKKAVEMEPDNGAFLDSLGWYFFKKGDFERALKELQRAAEVIKPEDPVVHEHIGDTYAQMGRVAEALRAWEKALALDKENKKLVEKIEGAKQKSAATVPREAKRVE